MKLATARAGVLGLARLLGWLAVALVGLVALAALVVAAASGERL